MYESSYMQMYIYLVPWMHLCLCIYIMNNLKKTKTKEKNMRRITKDEKRDNREGEWRGGGGIRMNAMD